MLDEVRESEHDSTTADIDLGHFAPYLLKMLDRHFQGLLSQVLSEFDLTPVEWRILIIVTRFNVVTIDDIVRILKVPQSTISRTVQKLHDRRLLRRAWNERDGRVAEIRISKSGEKRKIEATEVVMRTFDEEVARLVADDAKQWIEIMRKILRRLGAENYLDID